MNDGTFKIGEIAILQNLAHPFACANGDDCEIVDGMHPRNVIDILATVDVAETYLVKYRGVMCAVCFDNLKKKPAAPGVVDVEFVRMMDWLNRAKQPIADLVEA